MTRTLSPQIQKLKPRKVGFAVRHFQPLADAVAVDVARYVLSRGAEVILSDESKSAVAALRAAFGRKVRVVPKSRLVESCDMIIVIGGDGTFLSVARLMRSRSVPLLGINMGQLGFLTEVKRGEAIGMLARIFDGEDLVISQRAMLDVTLKRKNKVLFRGPIVNDAVISKGAIARIIGLKVVVDGKWVHDVRADGIIVATPTGSTAYSLAAGGPIIEPSLSALVMTPICPHSLTQRPLVLSDDATIEIHLQDRPGHVTLTVDGQDAIDMKEGDVLMVRRFETHCLKLISNPARDYFTVLREKLNFGMRN